MPTVSGQVMGRACAFLVRFWRSAAVSVLLALLLCGVSLAGPPSEPSPDALTGKRILVLHSFGRGVKRMEGMAAGINQALAAHPGKIQQLVEYLDVSVLGRSPDYPTYLAGKRAALEVMLAAAPVDAVLLADRQALLFWIENADTFGRNLPVVYCGAGEAAPEELRALPQATAVVERPAFRTTVDMALKLFPYTDKLLVIGEEELLTPQVRRLLHDDMEAFLPRVSLEYFPNSSMKALEARLKNMEPGWALLVVGRPGVGEPGLNLNDTLGRIAAVSHAPVFSVWPQSIGHGPVGGAVGDSVELGRRATSMVLDVLSGRAPASMSPVVLTQSSPLFDYQQLQRFNVPESALPTGSTVLNRPDSLFETHRELVLTYALVCLLLLTACGVLAYHIVNRRKLENKLAAQVNFVGSLMAAMPTPVFYKDVAGIYQGCNPAFATFMNMDISQLVGHSVMDLYPREEAEVYKRMDDALFNGQSVQIYEYEKATPEGPRQVRFHKAIYRDATGKVAGLVGVIADITDLRRAEKEVETTRNYLQAIINASPSVMFCVDEQGRITHANTNARESGKVLPGASLADLPPRLGGLLDVARKAIAEGKPQLPPRIIRGGGGATQAEETIVYPLTPQGLHEAVVRIDDVSEQHHMQEMLAESEKMMSVGGLAAGMAHEINNPLGGVMQSAQVIVNRLRPDLDANIRAAEKTGCSLDSVIAYLECRGIFTLLEDLRESAKRAAQVVSNMLEFSRRSTSAWLPDDLNAIIERTLALCLQDYSLMQRYDFKKITIVRDLAEPPVKVPCSAPQIQQVLFNLLRNAAQAMFQADTPEPTITVRCHQEKGWAVLAVEDNGPGMEESVRRKVFEPFFTTKEPDSGSGLGLSVSYFIVRQNHCGEFEVESSPGQGARFIIRLPMTGGRNGAPSAQASE